jgi:cobalt-zinc-cadmium efflux system membrane fusion protein
VSGRDERQTKAGTRLRARAMRLSVVAAGAAAGIFLAMLAGPGVMRPVAGQASGTALLPPGVFRPSESQWKGFKIAPVAAVALHAKSATEGNIALDHDLATPVYSPYSGRVVKLIAQLGDMVRPGSPLFAVEAAEFVKAQNDLIAARSAQRTAAAQLSQIDQESARNAMHTAEIALATVRNRLHLLGKSDQEVAALEATPPQQIDPVAIIGAPIAGTVTQRRVDVGQAIDSAANGATIPAYTIVDLSTVWLAANVRDADVPLMHLGAAVEVRTPAYPGRVFGARISWVGPALDPNTHLLPVRADVENPDGALKPAMFASFSVTTGMALAVPRTGIVYEGGAARVWLAYDDQTVEVRPVKTGRVQDGMVEILDGIKAGDKIVTSGAPLIDRAATTD